MIMLFYLYGLLDYHLAKCIEVITAWGFEYKTVGFAWAKKNKKVNKFVLWEHTQ